MVESLSSLSAAERARRCRELAKEAEANAQRARSAQLRDGYLNLATTWRDLAAQNERMAEPVRRVVI